MKFNQKPIQSKGDLFAFMRAAGLDSFIPKAQKSSFPSRGKEPKARAVIDPHPVARKRSLRGWPEYKMYRNGVAKTHPKADRRAKALRRERRLTRVKK